MYYSSMRLGAVCLSRVRDQKLSCAAYPLAIRRDKMSCTSISKCGAWAFGASFAIAVAFGTSDARAQVGFYFGPEGGWTGLQGTKNSVTGTNPVTGQSVTFPINQSFNSGWNVGARGGYQWGPGGLRESTATVKMVAM